jgi:hypothetical protein
MVLKLQSDHSTVLFESLQWWLLPCTAMHFYVYICASSSGNLPLIYVINIYWFLETQLRLLPFWENFSAPAHLKANFSSFLSLLFLMCISVTVYITILHYNYCLRLCLSHKAWVSLGSEPCQHPSNAHGAAHSGLTIKVYWLDGWKVLLGKATKAKTEVY